MPLLASSTYHLAGGMLPVELVRAACLSWAMMERGIVVGDFLIPFVGELFAKPPKAGVDTRVGDDDGTYRSSTRLT